MKYLFIVLLIFPLMSVAGGWSSYATPTKIDIERGKGFMVYGEFGNPESCTTENRFYVKIDHPQYEEIYSTVLAAFMSGKKVQAYIHLCEAVTWYAVLPTTFNILTPDGALNIKN